MNRVTNSSPVLPSSPSMHKQHPRQSLLFSPLVINGVRLENRVCIPAMVTWLSPDGSVTDDIRQRYLRYAQGEPGMIVLEAMPALLAAEITAALSIPTIGIGAGGACSGQVLVLHDMLDVYPGKKARFVKNYMQGADSIAAAVKNYVAEVKTGSFPEREHSF